MGNLMDFEELERESLEGIPGKKKMQLWGKEREKCERIGETRRGFFGSPFAPRGVLH